MEKAMAATRDQRADLEGVCGAYALNSRGDAASILNKECGTNKHSLCVSDRRRARKILWTKAN